MKHHQYCQVLVLQRSVMGLTVHKGWNGPLIVSIGEEDQFLVDKLGEGHMVNPLAVQEGLQSGGGQKVMVALHEDPAHKYVPQVGIWYKCTESPST